MIVALAALAVAIGGVAYATIPDSGGTVHACYQKNGGGLRVVESSDGCRPSEASLDWSQRGPQGSPGAGGKTFYAEANVTQCTSSTTETALGPSVRVDIPPNSFMAVLIQAEGSAQPGDQALLGLTAPGDSLANTILASFRPGYGGTSDFVTDPPLSDFALWHVRPAPSGSRTYSVTYLVGREGESGAPHGPACFRNRRLWISVFSPS
jgi:hypothetical protein